VSRVAGADRFATAVEVSRRAYPEGVEVAYVASGLTFADALTGGVAAARESAPLLLVTPGRVPAVTAGELERLAPERLVIVGGRGVVSESVASQLADYAGQIERLADTSRFGTAGAVARAAFDDPSAVETAYVASGQTFADALAGVPAAASADAPLLLATRQGLPAATRSALARLAPQRIVLLGGPGALGPAVAEAAGEFAATVDRLAGPTRYATAAAVAGHAWPEGAGEVMVATGTGFADALAGGAVAGTGACRWCWLPPARCPPRPGRP
jgi:putative cell wall-binding protein